MNWFGFVLVVIFMLNALVTIGTIGNHRDPITPSTAVVIVAVNSLLILGIVAVGTGCLHE
jgi:hypothetical protein